MTTIDLSGKTALITGSGQGLGRATAGRLHAAGASVVINYLSDAAGVNESLAREAVRQLGERAAAIAGDVRDVDSVESLLDEAVQHFGGLDIVVNNAGVLRDRALKNMTEADWQDVIDTNLTGMFHVCRAVRERIADGGRIVNMASIAGVVGFYGQANYAAAKAGVIGLTKALSKEFAGRNITVNAVAPGVALTEMGQSIPEQVRERMLAEIPLGRFAEPDEIAKVVLFLASDLSSYVTGQTIHVNGGWWG